MAKSVKKIPVSPPEGLRGKKPLPPPPPSDQVMVPVVVAVVGEGDIFVGPLNDLVGQSRRNKIDRYFKVRTTFPKWPLSVTSQF